MEWEQAWLKYGHLKTAEGQMPDCLYYNSELPQVRRAVEELDRFWIYLTGQSIQHQYIESAEEEGALIKGSESALILLLDCSDEAKDSLGEEGYDLGCRGKSTVIAAAGGKGILYGTFALIRALATGNALEGIQETSIPVNPLRIMNHWDNSDGSIERGYSGKSFFFEDGKLLINERTLDYARLMASIGINAVVINNVNVAGDAIELITHRYFPELKVLSELFDTYGIGLFLSLDYAAPVDIDHLESADPLDSQVIGWWQSKMKEVFEEVPKLGGFLIKADSEGRPGPFTYGRSHAEGANMLGEAIEPYGGILIWRCFVYNCQQDWRDRVTDRAKAGYDTYKSLDGQFRDNVILQVKNGPMDFQVREPVSPLFGAMPCTNLMLEVQIAQEYTGQQRHICYLPPMWKEVLDFDTHCSEKDSRVSEIVSGGSTGNRFCGMAAVTNTGNDRNWTGHDLAASNLYGFGRLAWDPCLTSEAIANEWITQTFGDDKTVEQVLHTILMDSWPAYEQYTSPLGIGWMVNPNHHYGPNVDGYEYDRWGTYHRADNIGIGVDRSDRGTGYAAQYFKENHERYNDLSSCPEELLLFFHHVPYTYRLKSGKTLIQHIYDSHFEGAEKAAAMKASFASLEGRIDPSVYVRVMERMNHQTDHAKEWRDVINTYFLRKSGTMDEQGRTIY